MQSSHYCPDVLEEKLFDPISSPLSWMMMMIITLDGRRRVPNPLSRQQVLHKRDALPDWILVCAAMMMMNPSERSKETDSKDKV
jgi:hypothetical protein